MKAMLGISLYKLSLSQLAKMLCLIIAYFYSSAELEKSAEQVSAWK
jgi:hypothetical protein